MTKQTQPTPEFSSLGRGEQFLQTLITELTREWPAADRLRFTDTAEGKGA